MAVMRKVALALVLACLLALALAPGMVAAASGRKGKGGARKGASPRREVAVDSDGDLDEEGEDFEDEGRLAATARTFKVEHSTDGLTVSRPLRADENCVADQDADVATRPVEFVFIVWNVALLLSSKNVALWSCG